MFVRLMSRPQGDAALARRTVQGVLDLFETHARPQRVQVHDAVALSAERSPDGRRESGAGELAEQREAAVALVGVAHDGRHEVGGAGVGQPARSTRPPPPRHR